MIKTDDAWTKQVVCWALAALLANGLAIWDAQLTACENAPCTSGCHLYTNFGEIDGVYPYTYWCFESDAGIYWDVTHRHSGATVPGGTFAFKAHKVAVRKYETCCKKCAGPISESQELVSLFDLDVTIDMDQNECKEA
jgi:hypothetical protein